MLVRVTYACIHARHILHQLLQAAQLGATTGNHYTAGKPVLIPRVDDLVVRHLDDLFHACLDDVREVLYRYFFRSPVADAGNGNYLVGRRFFGYSFAKAGFELLGLLWQHHEPLLDVVGNDVATERYYRGMAYDVIIKYGDIGSASAD